MPVEFQVFLRWISSKRKAGGKQCVWRILHFPSLNINLNITLILKMAVNDTLNQGSVLASVKTISALKKKLQPTQSMQSTGNWISYPEEVVNSIIHGTRSPLQSTMQIHYTIQNIAPWEGLPLSTPLPISRTVLPPLHLGSIFFWWATASKTWEPFLLDTWKQNLVI